MVVASAVNEEGEELYPRKWNHSFIDLPRTRNPKQPFSPGQVVTRIVAAAKKEEYQLFFALCGGMGLRFGEALGIKVQDTSPDCSTITIVQKAWTSQIHSFLKTHSGCRELDLYPALAAMLKEYLDKRQGTLKSDLLFQSRSGKLRGKTVDLRLAAGSGLRSDPTLCRLGCGYRSGSLVGINALHAAGIDGSHDVVVELTRHHSRVCVGGPGDRGCIELHRIGTTSNRASINVIADHRRGACRPREVD
jgi:integrase